MDQKKKISELPECTSTDGLWSVGVDNRRSVKFPIGELISSVTPVLMSEDEFDRLQNKDENRIYFIYEE